MVGAHLSGMPLNAELTRCGASFVRAASTAPEYRLYALPGGPPKRPGLVRVGEGGAADRRRGLGPRPGGVRRLSSRRSRRRSASARSASTTGQASRVSCARRRRRTAPATSAASAAGAPMSPRSAELSSMKETWAAAIRHPSGVRTQVCIWRPSFPATLVAAEQGRGDGEVRAVGGDHGAVELRARPAGDRAARNAAISLKPWRFSPPP